MTQVSSEFGGTWSNEAWARYHQLVLAYVAEETDIASLIAEIGYAESLCSIAPSFEAAPLETSLRAVFERHFSDLELKLLNQTESVRRSLSATELQRLIDKWLLLILLAKCFSRVGSHWGKEATRKASEQLVNLHVKREILAALNAESPP